MEGAPDRYCRVTKTFLLITGQWPYQRRRQRICRTFVLVLTALIMNVPQVCKFVQCNGNIDCIMGTATTYILVPVVLTNLYMFQVNSGKIKILTDRLYDNWIQFKLPEEREIMGTYVVNTKWNVVAYTAICFVPTILFTMMSFVPRVLDAVSPLNESRPIVLPYEAYYFVDEREYFYYIFFHGFVTAMMLVTALVAYNTMFITFVEHVCSVFAVAGFRSERLVYAERRLGGGSAGLAAASSSDPNSSEYYRKRLALCVHAHWAALEFAELLESAFSLNFTVELILETIMLSITLFQFTLRSDEFIEAIRYLSYFGAQLLHLFVFSWQSQKLIDHSLRMRDKIYSCHWYDMPVKSQRLILHIMRRSLRPNFLSASRIFIFSMQSYTMILQTSMSYFTVLSSVR